MTGRKGAALALALAVPGFLAGTAGGCATAKNVPPPKPAETTAQGAPALDTIEYLMVAPWAIKPGEKAQIEVRAAKNRRLSLTLTGVDAKALGTTRTVTLAAREPGLYVGEVVADSGLPLGKYRIEVVLGGGPSGEPVSLHSSRALTVAAPAPPQTSRDDGRQSLPAPHSGFVDDQSAPDPAAAS